MQRAHVFVNKSSRLAIIRYHMPDRVNRTNPAALTIKSIGGDCRLFLLFSHANRSQNLLSMHKPSETFELSPTHAVH